MERMRFIVELKSMIGIRRGTLSLCREEERLSAEFDFPGNTAYASGTMTETGELQLSGMMQTFYRKQDFSAKGSLKENSIFLVLETNGKKYRLEGRKIPNEEAV